MGKYIYENAVMGELAQGRTRILATHHVSLCLPRADYAVRLSATGVLEHAGLIKDLQQTGTLDEILKADDVVEPENIVETDNKPSIPSADRINAPPKKLHEAEARETGRVKNKVYTGYLNATGGWTFWSFFVILYVIAQGFTLGRTYWVRIWVSDFGKTKDLAISFMASHYQMDSQTRISGHPISSLQLLNPINSTETYHITSFSY